MEKFISLLFNGENSKYIFEKIQSVNNYDDIITEAFNHSNLEIYKKNKNAILDFHSTDKQYNYNSNKKNNIKYNWNLLSQTFSESDWVSFANNFDIKKNFFKKMESYFFEINKDKPNILINIYLSPGYLNQNNNSEEQFEKFCNNLNPEFKFNINQLKQICLFENKNIALNLSKKFNFNPLINIDLINYFFFSSRESHNYQNYKIPTQLFSFFQEFIERIPQNQLKNVLNNFSLNNEHYNFIKLCKQNKNNNKNHEFLLNLICRIYSNFPESKYMETFILFLPLIKDTLGQNYLSKIDDFIKSKNELTNKKEFIKFKNFYEKIYLENILPKQPVVIKQKNKI